MIILVYLSLASLFVSNSIEIMAEEIVDNLEALSTSSDGDTTGYFVISFRTRFHNECGMKHSFFRLLIFSRKTLFRLGFLKTLYDWGTESARAPCSLISQQLLALELSFKFV